MLWIGLILVGLSLSPLLPSGMSSGSVSIRPNPAVRTEKPTTTAFEILPPAIVIDLRLLGHSDGANSASPRPIDRWFLPHPTVTPTSRNGCRFALHEAARLAIVS